MYFFDELEDGLFISPTPRKSGDICDLPIQAILNLCDKELPEYARELSPSTELLQCYFPDEFPVPYALLENSVLELAQLRKQGKGTLVHCRGGNSRSPTVVFFYWMARDRVDWDTAYKKMRSCRPGWLARPNELLPDSEIQLIVETVSQFLAGQHELLIGSRKKLESIDVEYKG